MDAVDYVNDCIKRGVITHGDLLLALNNSRARKSEFLTRKRNLSLNQIRTLVFNFGLEAEFLLVESAGPNARAFDKDVS